MENKIAAVIAEYNPFHNGHRYQLETIKKTHKYVIAVMSGSFVQRGDVAILDKWLRAEAAVRGGADLVAELPAAFALNNAERFAFGAVSLINALNVCDTLFFGSETNDLNALVHAAEILSEEPAEARKKLKNLLDSGAAYPVAREKAFSGFIKKGLMRTPNNILGIEYIKALRSLGSNIQPAAIKRIGSAHNSAKPIDGYASASYIRNSLGGGTVLSEFTDKFIYSALINPMTAKYKIDRLDTAITAFLRTSPPEYISRFNEVGEGLENRLIHCARQHSSFSEICTAAGTKRYTMSRIRRAVLSAFLGITPQTGRLTPRYLRILASGERGFEIINRIKNSSDITIITKAADYKKDDPLFITDVRATDIAALCASLPSARTAGQDFTTAPVIVHGS